MLERVLIGQTDCYESDGRRKEWHCTLPKTCHVEDSQYGAPNWPSWRLRALSPCIHAILLILVFYGILPLSYELLYTKSYKLWETFVINAVVEHKKEFQKTFLFVLKELNVTRSSFLFFVAMFASRLTTFSFTVQFCFQVFQTLVAFVDCSFFSCVSCTQIYEDEKVKLHFVVNSWAFNFHLCLEYFKKNFCVKKKLNHWVLKHFIWKAFVNNVMRIEVKHSRAFLWLSKFLDHFWFKGFGKHKPQKL